MPYIKPCDRKRIDDAVDLVPQLLTSGELNYTVTRLCDRFLSEHGFNYTNINQAIGVLECAKLELYRRLASPYEDIKIAENGDVYKAGKGIVERGRALVKALIGAFAWSSLSEHGQSAAADGRQDAQGVGAGEPAVPYETSVLAPQERGCGQPPTGV